MTLSTVDLELPWKLSPLVGIENVNGITLLDIDPYDGHKIYFDDEQVEFIVRAVNNHEALVAMLEEMAEYIGAGDPLGLVDRARELLASLDQ